MSFICNVVCPPVYSSRGARTRVLGPDMWAQGQNRRSMLWSIQCQRLGSFLVLSECSNVRSAYSIDFSRLLSR
jgi:hypothetical protein